MKPYLLAGVAAFTFLCTGIQAQAGTYGTDNPRMMRDTQRMGTESQNTVAPRRTKQVDAEQVRAANIEPAAGRQSSPYDDFTGFYGGADVGYGFSEDVEGWNGSVFAGYGLEHEFHWLGAYAGIELAHEWSDGDGSTGALSFEKDHAWIATVRPGVSIMGDGLGYGIIGYSRAEFESGGDEEYLDGLVLGLGGQFNTGMPFKPRLEYTYTNYEDASIGGTDFAATENAVKLGAVFQF